MNSPHDPHHHHHYIPSFAPLSPSHSTMPASSPLQPSYINHHHIPSQFHHLIPHHAPNPHHFPAHLHQSSAPHHDLQYQHPLAHPHQLYHQHQHQHPHTPQHPSSSPAPLHPIVPALPSHSSPAPHPNARQQQHHRQPSDDTFNSTHPHNQQTATDGSPPDPPGLLYGPPDGALATSYVGNYTLFGTIGEGAFGKVKIAVDRRSSVRVAIKIMDKGEIRAQDFTAQVRREIYIMRCLKHRHIVRMIEVLTSDTKLYIVMELVTGGELFERIEKGRVTEDKARRYFQQLVDGVDFCHKKGVAHRDLKPENLLLDENGDIKITDFGFSSMKGMDVNTGLLYTQCGTPDYCAPEIIDSAQKGYTGAKVDAWSCGIILYALLCGRLPFQEPDTEKLYDLILACRVRYPPFVSAEARNLLENLLLRDPNKRFDLYKVKRHPWFLVDYTGDDAKLIKKRPFYKNQPDPHGSSSTPSSPMVPQQAKEPTPPSSSSHSGPNSGDLPPRPTSTADNPPVEHEPPASPYRTMQGALTQLPQPPQTVGSMATSSLTTTPSPLPNQQQPLMDAGTPRNIHSGSNIAARMRDDAYGTFRPTSPAADAAAMHARVPTPPVHDVFTKVEVRPATPARRQHSATTANAFQAAMNASMHGNPQSNANNAPNVSSAPNSMDSNTQPALMPSKSAGSHSRTSTPNIAEPVSEGLQSAAVSNGTRARLSPQPPSATSQPPANGSLDSSGFSSMGNGPIPREDLGSSSDPDSVEDYENKPAPCLDLPGNHRQIARTMHRPAKTPPTPKQQKPPTQAQIQAQAHAQAMLKSPLPVSQQPRQRSDLTGTAFAHAPVGEGSTSLSSIRPRRKYGRDGPNSGSLIDQRTHRLSRSDIPNSPPVVYSPSPVNNHYERFRSMSPGFSRTNGGSVDDGGPSSGHSLRVGSVNGGGQYGQIAAQNNSIPWKSSSSIGYGSLRDEATGPNAGYGNDGNANGHLNHNDVAGHLWGLMNRLRGTSEPANLKLSKELRKDYNTIAHEIRQLKQDEVAHMVSSFLSLFENHALTDQPASSPSHKKRSRMSGQHDDAFSEGHNGVETGSHHGPSLANFSRHHSGGGSAGMLRRAHTGTDISSEEEPLSLSPVVAESTGPQMSDLARRRNLSDLLTKWIKSTEDNPQNGQAIGATSQALVPVTNGHYHSQHDDEDVSFNLGDLQRMVAESHGGREASNVAEDLMRLLSSSEDANSTSTFGPGSNNQPGQSPPPPHVQTSRSHDSYTQTRYHSNMSNTSGVTAAGVGHTVVNRSQANNMLPSEYVPGRFIEPKNMAARARSGAERVSGLSGRTDVQRPGGDELTTSNSARGMRVSSTSGTTSGQYASGGGGNAFDREGSRMSNSAMTHPNGVSSQESSSHMANSMGMHDVPYYMSDRRGNMANKLRGVLQNMKTKNHRLGEVNAHFKCRLPPDEILRLLARVLQDMGGSVTVKKETKRKMKCHLELKPGLLLHAIIELIELEEGETSVHFRRSKADRGRTDTDSFHTFFVRVKSRFIDEANATYPQDSCGSANASPGKLRMSKKGVSHGSHTSGGGPAEQDQNAL